MFRFVLAAVLAAFLCLPSAVAACTDFDALVGVFSRTGAPFHVFTEEELPTVISTLEGTADRDLDP